MAYLEDLIQQTQISLNQAVGADLGLPRGQAYSSYFPTYEVSTPAQNVPNNYSLAESGYHANEFAYSIILTRALAKSQAECWVYDNTGETPEEVLDHPIRDLLQNANQLIDESMFWQIKQIYQDIAGFSAWEIETNLLGEPIRLWPMLPHFCSFMRGEQQMIRNIRYQPYGLPPQDIPMERVLFFTDGEDLHPIYPQLRFISPLAHALPQVQIDNAMTFFLNDFVKHGAKFSGLLSVSQTIDETTAQDYKRRFRDAHGGTQNWTDPLVLGLGATYQTMQMNFKDMAFPEMDARIETRICNAFNIDPIVANARAGLDVSSYNNKDQAERGWFYKWVVPSWKSDARKLGQQLLPFYHEDPKQFYCGFDLSEVYSLREDRDAQVKRAVDLYTNRVAKLNEAREEIDLDPIDGDEGDSFYEAVNVHPQENVNPKGEVQDVPVKPVVEQTQAQIDATNAEVKDFRAFAKRRIKEGKIGDIALFEFKHVDIDKAAELVRVATGEAVFGKLDALLEKG